MWLLAYPNFLNLYSSQNFKLHCKYVLNPHYNLKKIARLYHIKSRKSVFFPKPVRVHLAIINVSLERGTQTQVNRRRRAAPATTTVWCRLSRWMLRLDRFLFLFRNSLYLRPSPRPWHWGYVIIKRIYYQRNDKSGFKWIFSFLRVRDCRLFCNFLVVALICLLKLRRKLKLL